MSGAVSLPDVLTVAPFAGLECLVAADGWPPCMPRRRRMACAGQRLRRSFKAVPVHVACRRRRLN